MKHFCIALTIAALFLQMTSCGKRLTPDELFEEAVGDPIPPSVQILNATQQTGLSGSNIWIHFKISPEDWKLVWRSEAFGGSEGKEAKERATSTIALDKPPKWWNPLLLEDEMISLGCAVAPRANFDGSAKEMFVNKQRTEVFFRLSSWYNY